MRRYDLGDAVDLRHEVRNPDGALITADVTLTVYKPSGETSDILVTETETGIFDATIPATTLDELGPYRYEWIVDGAVDDVKSGQFYTAHNDEIELPPLASIDRLFSKIGYALEGAELDRAEELLIEASDLVRDTAGITWASDTGHVSGVPRRVQSIVLDATWRAFSNPEGLSQRSIGDSSKAYHRTGVSGGAIVYLTPEEQRAIRKAAGTSSLVVATLASPYGGTYLDPWVEATLQ